MTRTNCSEDTRRNIRIRYKYGRPFEVVESDVFSDPGIRAVSTVFGNVGNAAKAPTAILQVLNSPTIKILPPADEKKREHISVIPRFPCI